MRLLRSAGFCCLSTLLLGLSALHVLADDSTLPPNLDRHLREMVTWNQTEAAGHPASERLALLAKSLPAQRRRAQYDETASRVVVDVRLNGTQPLANVQASLEKLGVDVFAQSDLGGSGSVLSAHLPLDRVVEASQLPGVHSIMLVRRPQHHVGAATSQGVGAIHSDQVNTMGYTGTGITVGVLSDSFDVTTPHAVADVASGDLPGPGSPNGFTKPVFVLAEGSAAASSGSTDEGRAMLQIVHDVAPGASLAFATTGSTQESFAANIRALRINSGANCDILVDDVTFGDEPFFSDGVISQAIDDVVHSTTLAGKKVAYYTAAGNSGGGVYIGDFSLLADATARAGLGNNNLNLSAVPEALTAGGFHNFNPKKNKTPIIVQRVTIKGTGQPVTDGSDTVELNFQWDDPFVPNLITTDYNLLVFDSNGNYLPRRSGTDNNFSTGAPSEFTDLNQSADGSDATYQIVITRTAAGTQAATHLRVIAYAPTSIYQTDNFSVPTTPSVFGHQAPPGGDSVAAYDYSKLNEPEDYSSVGPMTVYFDRLGNRLPVPDVRLQPTMAAPDGVDTSFFPAGPGNDTDNDGFPNFFGTSAAAPHAAATAALLLQAAGGPSSLTGDQIRSLLQSTAGPHDIDPSFSKAKVTSADGLSTVVLTASGDSSNDSAFDPGFFRLSFAGPPTRVVSRVTIDLSASTLEFDPTLATGFPFTISSRGTTIPSTNVIASLSGPPNHPNVLSLKIKGGVFFPGNTLAFGIDRDLTSKNAGGNSADLLPNAVVTIRTSDANFLSRDQGVFVNTIGKGNTNVDGFGLINAEAAVRALLGLQ